MSIVWLNLEANELVSVLEAFGLAFDIDSGEENQRERGEGERFL